MNRRSLLKSLLGMFASAATASVGESIFRWLHRPHGLSEGWDINRNKDLAFFYLDGSPVKLGELNSCVVLDSKGCIVHCRATAEALIQRFKETQ